MERTLHFFLNLVYQYENLLVSLPVVLGSELENEVALTGEGKRQNSGVV